jgi:hypothetical protein
LLTGVPTSRAVLGVSVRRPVAARWIADGRGHAGVVAALPGTPRGATVRVWVGRAGATVPAPLTRAAVDVRVIGAITLAALGVALSFWLLLSLPGG